MRVFLDTKVLASAFGTRGLCSDLFEYVLDKHELTTGDVVIEELRSTLKNRFGVSVADIKLIEGILRDQVVVPRPSEPHSLEIRDFDDKWVLASAVTGIADVLVTGDSDMLVVASQSPLPIMSPRDFWNKARGVNRSQFLEPHNYRLKLTARQRKA